MKILKYKTLREGKGYRWSIKMRLAKDTPFECLSEAKAEVARMLITNAQRLQRKTELLLDFTKVSIDLRRKAVTIDDEIKASQWYIEGSFLVTEMHEQWKDHENKKRNKEVNAHQDRP